MVLLLSWTFHSLPVGTDSSCTASCSSIHVPRGILGSGPYDPLPKRNRYLPPFSLEPWPDIPIVSPEYSG
jgi:hypothetical protein